MDMDNSVVNMAGEEMGMVVNGNEKNTIKRKFLLKKKVLCTGVE